MDIFTLEKSSFGHFYFGKKFLWTFLLWTKVPLDIFSLDKFSNGQFYFGQKFLWTFYLWAKVPADIFTLEKNAYFDLLQIVRLDGDRVRKKGLFEYSSLAKNSV